MSTNSVVPRAAYCLATALLCLAAAAGVAATPGKSLSATALKTERPSPQVTDAFLKAVKDFADARAAAGGKAPADAGARAATIRTMAGPLKAEWRGFAKRLKENGESAAFDAAFDANLAAAGDRALLADVRAAGGASAILANPDQLVDRAVEQIAGRPSNTRAATLLRLIGIASAEAGIIDRSCVAVLKFSCWFNDLGCASSLYEEYCGRSTVF